MNNKWTQVTIALALWGYLAFNVAKSHSALGRLVSNLGYKILPDGLLNIPGPWVIFILFSIIYFALGYIAIITCPSNAQDTSEDKS